VAISHVGLLGGTLKRAGEVVKVLARLLTALVRVDAFG